MSQTSISRQPRRYAGRHRSSWVASRGAEQIEHLAERLRYSCRFCLSNQLANIHSAAIKPKKIEPAPEMTAVMALHSSARRSHTSWPTPKSIQKKVPRKASSVVSDQPKMRPQNAASRLE